MRTVVPGFFVQGPPTLAACGCVPSPLQPGPAPQSLLTFADLDNSEVCSLAVCTVSLPLFPGVSSGTGTGWASLAGALLQWPAIHVQVPSAHWAEGCWPGFPSVNLSEYSA